MLFDVQVCMNSSELNPEFNRLYSLYIVRYHDLFLGITVISTF